MDEKVFLTAAQAVLMLDASERIHTFRNPTGGMMIGADWDREDILAEIQKADTRQIGGSMCQSLKHGLVLDSGNGPLFVECKPDLDYVLFEMQVRDTQEQKDSSAPGKPR